MAVAEFFVKINLYDEYHVDKVVYYRRYMDIEFILRWRWYFEYLSARLKVANPKVRIELVCGRIDLLSPKEYAEKKRQNLLRAKRGQVKKLVDTPDELDLFDIAINNKRDKISRIEDEIKKLENGEQIFWVYDDYINLIHDYI